MSNTLLKPCIAILADVPLSRILPDQFDGVQGHAIPWIYALFQELGKQANYNIHWITLSKHVTKLETVLFNNQTVHIIPQGSKGKNILCAHIPSVLRIRKVLNEINPNLIHVWGVENAYFIAGKCFKREKVLSYQGALTAYCQRAAQPFLLKLQAFWERRFVKHYHNITCESTWACQRVREIAPKSNISLMEYGVEESFFHLQRIPSANPSCLYAGTVNELKGLPYLTEAFTQPELSHVQLYIAGSGPLRKQLEALSTPNIHWLGSINREVLQKYLCSSWFLVHPTLADCCPNVVKEARVIGLPVITTPEGGQTQYVEDGKSGYIVPVRNSDAIKKAALKLAENYDITLEMGRYKQDEYRHLLDVQQTVNACLTRYNVMLKK